MDTKKSKKKIRWKNRRKNLSLVACFVTLVTCHQSCVSCNLSSMPTATATDPPPANSPTMHNRLLTKTDIFVLENQPIYPRSNFSSSKSILFFFKPSNQKGFLSFAILAIHSLTKSSSPQGSGSRPMAQTTHRQTDRRT